MAERPIFIAASTEEQGRLVREVPVTFTWHPGLAPIQKRRNVAALHRAAAERNLQPLLEVSTKSEDALGFRLSAFNLAVETEDHGVIPLEAAFQGSKQFERGGPFTDMYGCQGSALKKDERLRSSGRLIGFEFEGEPWGLEPKTAFYDWLYLHAVHREEEMREGLCDYAGYTDIEFNPRKSINCQARSCALYAALSGAGRLEEALGDRRLFLDLSRRDACFQSHSAGGRQGELFMGKG